jgi:hypothetical protein
MNEINQKSAQLRASYDNVISKFYTGSAQNPLALTLQSSKARKIQAICCDNVVEFCAENMSNV